MNIAQPRGAVSPSLQRRARGNPALLGAALGIFILALVPVGVGAETADAPREIPLTYYGEIGCAHCDTFVENDLPRLTERYGVTFSVEVRDILSTDGYAECRDRLGEMDRDFRVFPVLFVGNNAYQGNSAIDAGLEAEIEHLLETGSFRDQVPPSLDGSQEGDSIAQSMRDSIRVLPVFLAGLADGINPCAFATMLFLVSLMAMFGNSRRELLLVGLLYAATIFATYYALGLGLLTLLRQAMNVSVLRLILRLAVSASALIFGALALRDAILIRQGRSKDATLQLGTQTKRRIHAVMRSGFGSSGLIVGTIGAAFLVSLLELACTGQLYLPTIAYLVQTGSTEAGELLALGVYNLAFILPLLILFAAVFLGVGSARANRWFRDHAPTAKALTAVALLVLAAAVWLV
ncbi:MAG: cytochrome c biogenesis CcdA family protein [Alkalispirochaeta sp.]